MNLKKFLAFTMALTCVISVNVINPVSDGLVSTPTYATLNYDNIDDPAFVYGTTDDGFVWSGFNDLKIVSIDDYVGTDKDVVIPSQIDGLDVIMVMYYAFQDCTTMETITIPSSVTDITTQAFVNCSSLTTVNVESGVETIASGAFKNCPNLKEVILNSKDTKVDDIFVNCPNAKIVYSDGTVLDTPESDTPISDDTSKDEFEYQLNNDNTIKINKYTGASNNIVIPSEIDGHTVTTIGMNAFVNSTAKSISLPDTITTIESYAFWSCAFETFTIPDSVTYLGDWAFDNCANLKEVTLPDSLTYIGEGCFWACSSLESVTLPNNLKSIPKNMFIFCSSLEEIDVPNSVTFIGDNAFSSTALELNMMSSNEDTSLILGDGVLYKYYGTSDNLTIPSDVKYISSQAISDSVTNVTILENVIRIDDEAIGYNWQTGLSKDITIQGYSNTVAEKYATENGMNFVSLGEGSTVTEVTTSATEITENTQNTDLTTSESETTTITEVTTEDKLIDISKENLSNIVSVKKAILGITDTDTSLDYNNDGKINILDVIYLKTSS